jgi:ADP-ribose pyrophosphatase YjhB (NUDIX family)
MKRLYPDQPVVGIGVVIIKEGEIALIKRGNEPSKGKWTIPGGLVEVGESLEVAVIRETKEEVCLEVENPRLLDVVDNVDLDEHGKVKYHYVIIDYLVQVYGTIQAASDAERVTLGSFRRSEDYNLTFF